MAEDKMYVHVALPPTVHARLKRRAEQEERSMTNMAVIALRRGLDDLDARDAQTEAVTA